MRKYIVVDWDHTLTSRDSPENCWVYKAFEKVDRPAVRVLRPVVKYKLHKNPNKDPKGWEIKLVAWLAGGISLEDVYLGLGELPENKELIQVLKAKKDEGYKVVIVSAALKPAAKHWINKLQEKYGKVIDDVYGIDVNVKEDKIAGLNMDDEYTKLAVSKGIPTAKSFAIAELSRHGQVDYTIGNAPGDSPNIHAIKEFNGHFGGTHIELRYGREVNYTKIF